MAIINFGDKTFFSNPWVEFERMRREVESLAKNLAIDAKGHSRPTVYPALNISEDKDNIYVKAEIPGVDPQELDISIEGETLNIRGEREERPNTENVSFHRKELEYGRFSRAVTLPMRINVDRISAKNINGILTITLPKADEVKPRQITVSTD